MGRSAGASTFNLSGETCQTQLVSALVNQNTLYSQTLDLKQKNVRGFRNLNKQGNLITLTDTTFPNITKAIYYCLRARLWRMSLEIRVQRKPV